MIRLPDKKLNWFDQIKRPRGPPCRRTWSTATSLTDWGKRNREKEEIKRTEMSFHLLPAIFITVKTKLIRPIRVPLVTQHPAYLNFIQLLWLPDQLQSTATINRNYWKWIIIDFRGDDCENGAKIDTNRPENQLKSDKKSEKKSEKRPPPKISMQKLYVEILQHSFQYLSTWHSTELILHLQIGNHSTPPPLSPPSINLKIISIQSNNIHIVNNNNRFSTFESCAVSRWLKRTWEIHLKKKKKKMTVSQGEDLSAVLLVALSSSSSSNNRHGVVVTGQKLFFLR